MSRLLKPYLLLLLCVAGSLVRLMYGYWYGPWEQASDQMAWEILLEHGGFRYDALIHYPHEGGTILVSVLAKIVEWFTDFSSLTVAAVLLDFAFRYLQIKLVKQMFDLETAIFFGVWTIFAAPVMLPWGTVNFGLHALSAVFPFVALYLLRQEGREWGFHLVSGLFLGFAVWFSYSNLLLVPVFIGFRWLQKTPWYLLKYLVGSLSAVLALHLVVRVGFDAGFHLSGIELISIRGAEFSLADIEVWDRLGDIFTALGNSATVLPDSGEEVRWFRYLYFLFLAGALWGMVKGFRMGKLSLSAWPIPATIVLFLGMYGFSPFFYDGVPGNHVGYRHLTYILPLVSLMVVVGLSQFKFRAVWLTLFLLLGISRSLLLFTLAPPPANDIHLQAAGWVLGTKLGHDPERLARILEENENKALLYKGIGWGMGTSLFKDEPDASAPEVEQKIQQLIDLNGRYPDAYQEQLFEGLKFSFEDFVTPRLNKAIFDRYLQAVALEFSESDPTP